jgi:hypothetical protein
MERRVPLKVLSLSTKYLSPKNRGTSMKKTILMTSALVCGLAFAAVPAWAQELNGPGSANYGASSNATSGSKSYQSTEGNAAASGGPGTHAGAMRSGSAANSQKVYGNQNGYAPGRY